MIINIGIIGSGTVGQQLALGFLKSGYQVMIGTRTPEKLNDFVNNEAKELKVEKFADAAGFGELIILATSWSGVENAINSAGKENFVNKIVIDVTNPLVFDKEGQPPKPALGYPDSGGATIQKWIPEAKIVKAFNIVTSFHMANPQLEEGIPDMFIAGNDDKAKEIVADIITKWGWNSVNDLGNIDQSYLLEALALVWVRYAFLNNHWTHAFKLLKK